LYKNNEYCKILIVKMCNLTRIGKKLQVCQLTYIAIWSKVKIVEVVYNSQIYCVNCVNFRHNQQILGKGEWRKSEVRVNTPADYLTDYFTENSTKVIEGQYFRLNVA